MVQRYSGEIEGKEQRPPLHFGVVAIGNGAFGSPSTMVTKFLIYPHGLLSKRTVVVLFNP